MRAIIVLVVLVGGCVAAYYALRPSADALLAAARPGFDEAIADIDDGSWPRATAAWKRTVGDLADASGRLAGDGRSVALHVADARAEADRHLAQAHDAFLAAATQAGKNLQPFDALVDEIAGDATRAAWRTDRERLLAAIAAREEAERAEKQRIADEAAKAAARIAATPLARAYALVVVNLDGSGAIGDLAALRTGLADALNERMAPVVVKLVDRVPADPRACAGVIKAMVAWDLVSYGGDNGLGVPDPFSLVPTAATATIAIESRVRPSSLDGSHVLKAEAIAPKQISKYMVMVKRDENVRQLCAGLAARARTLPKLEDAAALADALADGAAAPREVWRYRFTHRLADGDHDALGKPTIHDGGDDIAPGLAAALRPLFGDALLAPAGAGPDADALGTLTIAVTSIASPYGRELSSGGLRTRAMTEVLEAITVAVSGARADGTAIEPRVFKAAAAAPQNVEREKLEPLAVEQRDRLVADVARQAAAAARR